MANPKLLDSESIEKKLETLDVAWAAVGETHLERVIETKDFMSAVELVHKIAGEAERQNHHPDIELSWGKVVVRLSTHSAHGLTAKDFKLAKAIDSVI